MAKQTLTREQQMLTAEQKEKLRYLKNGEPPKRSKRMSDKEAKAMAEESGVTVEEIRAMEAEAANESSARGNRYKKGGMVKGKKKKAATGYKKGGMVSNCGASVKATQKGTVKLACGGMAYKKK
jgi:hypothetical protein